MTTPIWLPALGLIIWGLGMGFGMPGIIAASLMAGGMLAANISGVRLTLGDRELNRAVDATLLVTVATLVVLIVSSGLRPGLLTAMSWTPVIVLPLLLLSCLNEVPLRMRHLAMSLRHSTHAEAALVVDAKALYLVTTLLATTVQAQPSPWIFWVLGGVVVIWIGVVRPKETQARPRGWLLFVIASVIALGFAHLGAQGLRLAQASMQDLVIDALTNNDGDTDPYKSQTRIGDVGRVKLSDRIVWRVRSPVVALEPILLRTGVFTQYRSGAWVAPRDPFTALAAAGPASSANQADYSLRGSSSKGAILLPVPAVAGRIDAPGLIERNPLGVIRLSDVPSRIEATISTATPATAATTAPATRLNPESQWVSPPPTASDLELPPWFAGVTAKLPEIAAWRDRSESARLASLQQWFATNFRYTLFLGDAASGGRDIQRFLLTDRAGHCEYFAASTVLLLRSLGIPARYVTGYSVQEFSQLENAYLVRNRHAHAWVEAHVAGSWVEVDTTPATWLTVEEQTASAWQPIIDLASFVWDRLGRFSQALFSGRHDRTVWVLAALLVLIAGRWLAKKYGRGAVRTPQKLGAGDTAGDPPPAELRAFHAMELEFSALGLGRSTSEPPLAWLARLAEDGRAVLDDARLAAARKIVDRLYRQRYGCGCGCGPGPD